jgi:hypothetical protein
VSTWLRGLEPLASSAIGSYFVRGSSAAGWEPLSTSI